jgi:TPR repeat protein
MKSRSPQQNKSAPTGLFIRADREEDLGNLRSAFRLFLAGAKAGDVNAQSRVGYCYDVGQGVRSNRSAALYWYMRAYRRGDAIAAHNIGTIWRDRRNFRRAEEWFQRAVRLGHDDGHLDIAKLYVDTELNLNPRRAVPHLNRVLRSKRVGSSDKREASRLLRQVRQMSGAQTVSLRRRVPTARSR